MFPALHSSTFVRSAFPSSEGSGGGGWRREEDKLVQDALTEICRAQRVRTGGSGGCMGGSPLPVFAQPQMAAFLRNLFASCEYGQPFDERATPDDGMDVTTTQIEHYADGARELTNLLHPL